MRRIAVDTPRRRRPSRTFLLFAVFVALALFGPVALMGIPRWTDSPMWRGVLVGLFVVCLKVPLILLLFAFIRRNKEWPGKPTRWSDAEVTEILESLRVNVERADGLPDREARLAHLSREAWFVADRLTGPRQVDALTVALQIDQRLIALRERTPAPGDDGEHA